MADNVPTSAAPATPTTTTETTNKMSPLMFVLAMFYLACLVTTFIVYATSPSFRSATPTSLGPLPVGVVWFGAVGAVVASFRGIFFYNHDWDPNYNYWHMSRPFLGAVTGSIGALLYWVSLHLGSSSPVTVNRATFYVVAFVLGFADKAFIELLESVTQVIIKPGQKTLSATPTPSVPAEASTAPGE